MKKVDCAFVCSRCCNDCKELCVTECEQSWEYGQTDPIELCSGACNECAENCENACRECKD